MQGCEKIRAGWKKEAGTGFVKRNYTKMACNFMREQAERGIMRMSGYDRKYTENEQKTRKEDDTYGNSP